ncbi:MAG TPA: nucleoside monophosphate kinase [Candidatus Paceibacterota bacterium]
MKAIIFFGPPGSGKGTQAEKTVDRFGFNHLETSKIIEEGFAKADPNNPEVKAQKERKSRGELISPALFAEWFNKKVEEAFHNKKNIVASGSMRTIEETELVLPKLENLYKPENIIFFIIKISEQESIKRNSERRICEKNKHTIPSGNYNSLYKNIAACPIDGSILKTREDDRPEIIKKRYEIFLKETSPVFDYLKKYGYKLIEINGEQGMDNVFNDITIHIKQ